MMAMALEERRGVPGDLEEERIKGNTCFMQGRFTEAVAHYSAAIATCVLHVAAVPVSLASCFIAQQEGSGEPVDAPQVPTLYPITNSILTMQVGMVASRLERALHRHVPCDRHVQSRTIQS